MAGYWTCVCAGMKRDRKLAQGPLGRNDERRCFGAHSGFFLSERHNHTAITPDAFDSRLRMNLDASAPEMVFIARRRCCRTAAVGRHLNNSVVSAGIFTGLRGNRRFPDFTNPAYSEGRGAKLGKNRVGGPGQGMGNDPGDGWSRGHSL